MDFTNYWLEPEYLERLADEYSQTYDQATPVPHVIIDNFLPEPFLDKVLEEFPNSKSIDWKVFDAANEKKLGSTSELQMGEFTRFLLYQFNSSVFIDFLEKLTRIEGIIPDPHFKGGGLHQIEKGGYLKLHVDFNGHKKLKVDRRLNVLIYLNKEWKEEYGGHFELWNRDVTQCEQKILPIFNRCVIFNTTDFSYHGHPEPLTCPDNMTRKSLALYYYSNGRPEEEIDQGLTPSSTSSRLHTTVFRRKPEEVVTTTSQKSTGKTIIKKLVPPIFLDISQSLFKKK
ncbi:MAG: 2OG-Fe(II) oxygenase [Crocosphaera sp.]|nr:2OG-Fe(II) oxygenase [Crocosphaera sp.]